MFLTLRTLFCASLLAPLLAIAAPAQADGVQAAIDWARQ